MHDFGLWLSMEEDGGGEKLGWKLNGRFYDREAVMLMFQGIKSSLSAPSIPLVVYGTLQKLLVAVSMSHCLCFYSHPMFARVFTRGIK